MKSIDQWMNRIPVPIPKTFEESDYPDHHMAKVRCRSCATTWDAVYPKVANVAAMECYNCHAKDSEVAKYHKYIYKN